MRRILITGSEGFVGRNLSEYYKKSNKLFLYKKGSSITEAVDFKPDIIFHCAAELYDEKNMFSSNIQLTYNLLDTFKNINRKFVYIGSSSEYGRHSTSINEQSLLKPNTLYEYSKACGSLLCNSFVDKYKNIIIIRPFSLYGPFEKKCRFIPTLYQSYKTGKIIRVVKDATHDWVYIEDFVKAVDCILQMNISDTVNIGRGNCIKNIDVYNEFCSIIGYKIKVEFIDDISSMRPFDTNVWVCDPFYLKNKYHYKFEYDLNSGLKKYTDFLNEFFVG